MRVLPSMGITCAPAGSTIDSTALLNQGMISLNFQRFLNGFKP
ncbi:hypothetical protein RintRC_1027 [Richelia intracellularis]|nr:hypothetical protein RintRC_1027 [Richelia intracellularis]